MKTCLNCKNTFKKKLTDSWDYFNNKRKYCSQRCYQKVWIDKHLPNVLALTNQQVKIRCDLCKKERMLAPSYIERGQRFCSNVCRLKMVRSYAKRGEDNYNWQGGKTPLSLQIRHSFEYKEWRKEIFERDSYTCQLCGLSKSGQLNVDHYPETFSELVKENNITSLEEALNCDALWDIKNNRTLCVDCHQLTPTYLNNYNKFFQQREDYF